MHDDTGGLVLVRRITSPWPRNRPIFIPAFYGMQVYVL